MEELRMEHRGKQTTDLPAMSAGAGMPPKPAEHLGLKEARAFSHPEQVVGTRDRVDSVEATEEGGEGEAFESEEDTDTKWQWQWQLGIPQTPSHRLIQHL